ncbi:VOC family protein [Nesterenkonia sp.]|uniref:VOC family protein n=1 Tax=Nesterenkonia sp. TaxID=704201 RepID=UPI002612F669|nr:VOC family protein [Nesterenkonia sp.]
MILCLPFLMFQGRAQEAIDLYLETFPDAELLEILHHPEGTEIYDPQTRTESTTEDDDEPQDDDAGAEDQHGPEDGETADADSAEADADGAQQDPGPAQDEDEDDDAPADEEPQRFDDTAAMETVVDWETTLVATAQLKIGGQVLMIQDSLVKRDFDFTPSISVAVVVDTEEEFTRITHRLAEGGEFLMPPDVYDFAANFAWVRDRFGVTWQINQPAAPDPEDTQSAANVAQAQAPDWS